ncbi:unnamed protein product [Chrysoparadoxa australica]
MRRVQLAVTHLALLGLGPALPAEGWIGLPRVSWTRSGLRSEHLPFLASRNEWGQEEPEGVPDTLDRDPVNPPEGITLEAWGEITRGAQDLWRRTDRTFPNKLQSPSYVVTTVLNALRHSDEPYRHHGGEVAIRFCSSTNPASNLSPVQMDRYMSDPALPFYHILGEWDEMDTGGALTFDSDGVRAYQQVGIRRADEGWATVNFDLVKEDECWLIQRLWVDDHHQGETEAADLDLFADIANDVMACRFSDYDPAQLVSWLEQSPDPSISAKLVAFYSLCALRANDVPYPNHGAEFTIRFCSPSNVASTLTPSHFSKYLDDPWYRIIGEWEELSMHSQEVDGDSADLVILLKRQGEEEWTSLNWELTRHKSVWLTEKIWVDDV